MAPNKIPIKASHLNAIATAVACTWAIMEYHDWKFNREWNIIFVTAATWIFFPYAISSSKNFFNTVPLAQMVIVSLFFPFRVSHLLWDLLLFAGFNFILYLPIAILVGCVQGFLDKRFEIIWK